MFRVQQASRCVHRLQQVPLRVKSSAAVAQDAAERTEAASAFDLARPFSDIPGPKPLPLIGNAWRFLPVIGKYNNLGFDELLHSLHAEYGPVCKLIGMPGPDAVYIADAGEAEKVYRNEGVWPSRRFGSILQHYYNNIRKNNLVSLATTNGKEWQDFRTAVNQVMMQPRKVHHYLEPIDNVTQALIDRMRLIRTADGRMPADFANELNKWTLESISYVALDTRLGLLAKDLDPSSEAVLMLNTLWGLFDLIYDLDIKPSPWKWVSTPAYRNFISGMDLFTELASKYVSEAMTRLKTMSREDLEKGSRSVLESLLLNTDDPSRAVSMALDMILAGVDSTSASTSSILYLLATNPEKQAKLQEELDRVIPDKNTVITKEIIEELKYMRACIKESMRVVPVFPCNFRDAGEDLVIGGFQVPRGTQTGYAAPVIYRMDKYYTKPEQFIPERWLPGAPAELKVTHPFAFLPFGFGPRMCIGKRVAHMEMEIIVAKVFRNFKLGWDQPPAKSKVKILRKYESPLQFTVQDRH